MDSLSTKSCRFIKKNGRKHYSYTMLTKKLFTNVFQWLYRKTGASNKGLQNSEENLSETVGENSD